MATLKRKNANGNWDFLQITGEEVTQLKSEVETHTAQLAQRGKVPTGIVSDKTTDNTSAVNEFIATLTAPDLVYIPINTKWNYNLITHPYDVTIIDESTYDWDLDMWTGQVKEIVNSSSPETKNANEKQFVAPYHPAYVIDNRDETGRTSYIHRRNGKGMWQEMSDIYNGDNVYVIKDLDTPDQRMAFEILGGKNANNEFAFNTVPSKGVTGKFKSRTDGSNIIRYISKNDGDNTVWQIYSGDSKEVFRVTFDVVNNKITFNNRITNKNIVFNADGSVNSKRIISGNPIGIETINHLGEEVYDTANKMWWKSISNSGTNGWSPVQPSVQGITGARPVNPPQGYMYYDGTLNKPIWWNGTVWKDSTGTTV